VPSNSRYPLGPGETRYQNVGSRRACRNRDSPPPALPAVARARQAATQPLRRLEHREIPAASNPLLGSGDGIVTGQASALIGVESGFATAT
jgi:hypothetical protein